MKDRLSTDSYKGVRDFYPEEMFIQNHILSTMRQTALSFGFVEYSASVLEPAELYQAKTGEEIVSEQTYTFKDRGGREVTLRPEMTPTVARMVSAKIRDYTLPLRWYSTPNLFRYEQPQRGRLREHWQLNADIFGASGEEADAEVISLAHTLFRNFGAKDADFVIMVNDRRIMDELYEHFKVSPEKKQKLSKIIDKKEKIDHETYKSSISLLLGSRSDDFLETVSSGKSLVKTLGETNVSVKRLVSLIDLLSELGVSNVIFEPTLMRGFDYYTGTIFEGFDADPKNKRSLFGGGRYDDLLSIFDSRSVAAVGLGVGDVTTRDFLETHSLLPEYRSTTDLCLCIMDGTYKYGNSIAKGLRSHGLNVVCDYSDKSLADKRKKALKDGIGHLSVLGENEEKEGTLSLKDLHTRSERKYKLDDSGLKALASDLLSK